MDTAQTIDLGDIKPQTKQNGKKTNKFVISFVLLLLLIFFSGFAFGTGYLWGKFQSFSGTKNVKLESTTPAKNMLQNVYEDKSNKFKLSYPYGWNATKRSSGIPGVVFFKNKSSVEVWLSVDQPVTFSSEQKSAIVVTNSLSLKIEEQTAKMTEYIYTAGNYFSIIKFSDKDTSRPLVTIWLKAEDQKTYFQTKEIAQSFIFN